MGINITQYLKKLEAEVLDQQEAEEVTPESGQCVPEPTNRHDFVHLHNHTDYSMLDGMCRIEDLVRRAAELGMNSVAVTDHGNLHGAIQFYKAARAAGIRPIIGFEVYYVPDMTVKEKRENWHLVLLAKDGTGYRNLMKITTAGFTEGFYYDPRVDLDLISQFSDGLIAMTACVRGYVPAMLLEDRVDEARAELGRMKDIFRDDLYAEVMNHGMPEQEIAYPALIKLAEKMGISAVATNDCHYIHADDAFSHEVLLCIQTKTTLADEKRFRFGSNQFYFKTADEMAALFPEEYLRNTLEVAEKCNLTIDLEASHLPQFVPPDGSRPDEYLRKRIEQGIQIRYGGILDEERRRRLEHEYEVITNLGYESYFLITDDVLQYCRRKGIPYGTGRGSAVASLVCYLLQITDLDPVTHGLMFERFLSMDREGSPDIDVDFDRDRRDEAMAYLDTRYGYAAQITTFNRFDSCSLIKAVGKVLGISRAKLDTLSKSIANHPADPLAEFQTKVQQMDGIDPRLLEIGTKLHGVIHNPGTHAGGMIVSNEPITDYVPLFIHSKKLKTQYDKDDVEDCGMLKLDILGGGFVAAVDIASKLIKERRGVDVDSVPMDDSKTYDLISAGDVYGVFQLGARWGREVAVEMKPSCFKDLTHLIAITRPGVLDADGRGRYFEARASGEVEYLHPDLEHILRETYGTVLYQEQVMLVGTKLAGFSWNESDQMRKAIAKKDVQLMSSMQTKFVAGCVANGVLEDTAEQIWEMIRYFSGYGFNKSHSTGYADLTYKTAYLKANYPLEYFTGLLSVKTKKDERSRCIGDIRLHGIRILPPDVNASTDRCTIVDDNTIRLPLIAVDRLAEKACVAIIQERLDGGAFVSYDDFFARVPKGKVNIRIKKNLVKAGAFDGLEDRTALLERILEVADPDILEMEREILGLYVTGHPLDDFDYGDGTIHIAEVNDLPMDSEFKAIGIIESVKEYVDRNSGLMAFVTIADQTHQLEVVVFASLYRGDLEKGDTLHVQGRLDSHEPLKAVAIDYELLDLQAVAVPA